MNENAIEGRNAVIEAFRAGKTIDRLYVQEGVKDGPVQFLHRVLLCLCLQKERLCIQ